MRLTEQQLYNMICESINDVLKEDNGPDVTGTFTPPTKPVQKISGGLKGAVKDIGKMVGKDAVKGTAINELLPRALSFTLGITSNIGGALCIFLGNLGVVYIAANLANNISKYIKLKNLQLPKYFAFAVKYANYAVDLRAEAQSMVMEAQQNVHAALDAWNQYYPDKLEWENIKSTLKSKGLDTLPSIREVNGGKSRKINPNINANFTDKYLKLESIRKHSLIEAAGGQTSVGKYLQLYASNDSTKTDPNGKEENLGIILTLSTTFLGCYSLWAEYTNYIDELVNRFQENGLTWENVLDKRNRSTLGRIAASLLNSIGSGKFGELVMPMQKRKQKQVKEKQKEIVLRVVSPKYNEKTTKGRLQSYILFREERTNFYFQVPNIDEYGRRILNVQQGEGYSLDYTASLLNPSNNAVTTNGIKIYGLKPDVLDMLTKIKDN